MNESERFFVYYKTREERYPVYEEDTKEKFFQTPKVLVYSERYKDLKAEDILAYSILMERRELSRKNGWYDKDTRRLYFKYSNEKLMELLRVGKGKIAAMKKRLIAADLLEQKRTLQGGWKYYLLHPEVTEEDIYRIDKLENDEEEPQKGKSEEKEPENVGIEPFPKIEHGDIKPFPKIELAQVRNSNHSNIYFSNTKLKDKNNVITKEAPEENPPGLYPDIPIAIRKTLLLPGDNKKAVETWSKMLMSYKHSKLYKAMSGEKLQTILKADLDFQEEIKSSLRFYLQKEKSGQIEKDFYGYVYKSFLAIFNDAGELFDAEPLPTKEQPKKPAARKATREEVVPEWLKEQQNGQAAAGDQSQDEETARKAAELDAKLKRKYSKKQA